MDRISLALNPPRFRKFRRPPIRLAMNLPRVWPLASINGRAPVILGADKSDPNCINLAYPRIDANDAVQSCPIGTSNGTATHLMPQMTPALAVDGGEITFAGELEHGFGIIIDHGNGWASQYANLQAIVAIRTDLYRPRPQYVRAGDTIGYVGAPEPGAFKQLRFALCKRDRERRYVPIDPRPHLASWKVAERYDAFTPAPPATRQEDA